MIDKGERIMRAVATVALVISAFVLGAFTSTISGGPARWEGQDPTPSMRWDQAMTLLEEPESDPERVRTAMFFAQKEMARAAKALASWKTGTLRLYSRTIRHRLAGVFSEE
jgi:hypothetical protein